MTDRDSHREFDAVAAHKRFSGGCFNRTWELLDKTDRTPRENDEMLAAAFASLWHWLQRGDATDLNLSIGYWQIARVFAVLGDGRSAVAWGEKCLAASQYQPAFYLAYAHEAIARGCFVVGDEAKKLEHLAAARESLGDIQNADEKSAVEGDLASIAERSADH